MIKTKDINIIIISSIFSVLSIVMMGFYRGNINIIVISSILMAVSEILFIPFIISFLSNQYPKHREILLKDTTLISVSISAVISFPLAGMMFRFSGIGVVVFILLSVGLLIYSFLGIKRRLNEESYRSRSNQ